MTGTGQRPMTPERATRLGRIWLWSAVAAFALSVPLMAAEVPFSGMLDLFGVVAALLSVEHSGWARGYRAARESSATSGADRPADPS